MCIRDRSIGNRFLRAHIIIALGISRNDLQRLSCIGRQNLVQLFLGLQNMIRHNLDVCGLALGSAGRLMNHNFGIGERHALSLCSSCQQEGSHAGSHAHTDGGHITLDILHRIVNRHTRGHGTARTVNIPVSYTHLTSVMSAWSCAQS